MPFRDGSFDAIYSMGTIEHFDETERAVEEMARVLKPGGRVCILEIARPEGALRRKLLEAYFRGALPMISRAVSTRPQSRKLWLYYWETIDQCLPGAAVLRALADGGFLDARRHVELGFFAEYTARRAH